MYGAIHLVISEQFEIVVSAPRDIRTVLAATLVCFDGDSPALLYSLMESDNEDMAPLVAILMFKTEKRSSVTISIHLENNSDSCMSHHGDMMQLISY